MSKYEIDGERLIFPPAPLKVRVGLIIQAVILGCVAVLFVLFPVLMIVGAIASFLEGNTGASIAFALFSCLALWLTYWAVKFAWLGAKGCFPCEFIVDRYKQRFQKKYKGTIFEEVSLKNVDRLVCEYSVSRRESTGFYNIKAWTGDKSETLYMATVGLLTSSSERQYGSTLQDMSIAMAEFLDLPLQFIWRGSNNFLAEPGASYNRKIQERRTQT